MLVSPEEILVRPPFSPIGAEGQDSVISQKEHVVLSLFHCHRGYTVSHHCSTLLREGGSTSSEHWLSWSYKKRSLSVSEGLMASPGPLWLIPNEKTLFPWIRFPSVYSLMMAGWGSTYSLLSRGQNGNPTWHVIKCDFDTFQCPMLFSFLCEKLIEYFT